MNYIYITGTSRGIGKAIAEQLLQDEDNSVIGISRSSSIEHERYEHVTLDLSEPDNAKNFDFGDHPDADKLVLLNNAGMLGDVKHVGAIDNNSIEKTFALNMTTPVILTNNFVKQYRDTAAEKIVLNVTSGAANRNIDGWSLYCSTKAQMDRFTQIAAEEQELDQPEHPFRIMAMTPSIVDTEMQTEIRGSDKEHFTNVEKFVEYKEENHLQDPDNVAKKFAKVINHPDQFPDVVFSVRDFEV
jgi:benzil reductase ((S)-benzoin forming)